MTIQMLHECYTYISGKLWNVHGALPFHRFPVFCIRVKKMTKKLKPEILSKISG